MKSTIQSRYISHAFHSLCHIALLSIHIMFVDLELSSHEMTMTFLTSIKSFNIEPHLFILYLIPYRTQGPIKSPQFVMNSQFLAIYKLPKR